MPDSYSAPRTALLDTTIWQVLPSNYNKIKARWEKIARLYDKAKSDVLAIDRAGALNSLKAELEMLEKDIEEYQDIVKGIDITDIAGLYVVAGESPHDALQIAKQDFEDLATSLKQVEEKIAEVKADVRYGLSEEN